MDMNHLVYISYAEHPFTDLELVELLQKARENNKRQQITGILLYAQQRFIQVLEGEEEEVRDLFERIAGDPRHRKVTVVLEGQHTQRMFSKWSMGFKSLTDFQFRDLSGYTSVEEFLQQQQITDDSHSVMIFLQLFYKKNFVDFPESISR
jgi:hypothetical protein